MRSMVEGAHIRGKGSTVGPNRQPSAATSPFRGGFFCPESFESHHKGLSPANPLGLKMLWSTPERIPLVLIGPNHWLGARGLTRTPA